MNKPPSFPLKWPKGSARTKVRRSDIFKVSFDTARRDLMASVASFGGTDCVITSNYEAFDNKAPADPGVALWFRWKGVWRCIACDTYSRFLANVRAVGLTVEALRSMERYGTQMLDQLMEGVSAEKALPAPPSARHWTVVLNLSPHATIDQIKATYRDLAKMRHPDSPGGSESAMKELNVAYERALAIKEGRETDDE